MTLIVLTVQFGFIALGGAVVEVAAQSVQESVTGDADFVNTVNGNHLRYSVNAIRHRDDSVSGEFEVHIDSPTGAFVLSSHVIITCFTITGNIARIGGIVDRSEGAGAPPGTPGFITVVDNGEGTNDLPDLASPPGVGAGTMGLPRPLFPVERGNIQVRPSGF
jgi:hypothetical protein